MNDSIHGKRGKSGDVELMLARAEARRALAECEIQAPGKSRRYKDGTIASCADMSASGTVTGYASTFDRIPDSYGDVIARGAFARTLEEWRAKGLPIPLLYGHVTNDPMLNIGRIVDAREDARGLYVKAEFDADNEVAQYVRKLVNEGRVVSFSFGYAVREQKGVRLSDGTQANELRDVDLFEVSLVQIPANPRAVVTSSKRGYSWPTEAAIEAAKAKASALLKAGNIAKAIEAADELAALLKTKQTSDSRTR